MYIIYMILLYELRSIFASPQTIITIIIYTYNESVKYFGGDKSSDVGIPAKRLLRLSKLMFLQNVNDDLLLPNER